MRSHDVLLQAMRRVLQDIGIPEVPAAGEFSPAPMQRCGWPSY